MKKINFSKPQSSYSFKVAVVALLFFLTFFHLVVEGYYSSQTILPNEVLLLVALIIVICLWMQEVRYKNYLLKLQEKIEVASKKLKDQINIKKQKENELKKAYNDIEQKIKQRTEDLLKANDYADRIFQVVPDAVFAIDKNKYIVNWNKKAEQITGYSSKDMVGKRCLGTGKFSCKKCCDLFDILKENAVIDEKCSFMRKDGQIINILKSIELLKDDKGNILGAVESFKIA